jgi:two-component system KDP operon response regulator KdpE
VLDDERPDLVVLDLMMPGIDGYEALRRIHETSHVPVIMLTARAADADRLRGFQSGADDYLTKPFNPDELAARVKSILRRTATAGPRSEHSRLQYPGLEIDLEMRRVLVEGAEVRLSSTEWELLAQLAGNAGRVMSQRELLNRIWGPEFGDETHYLRTWISRLRGKLQPGHESASVISTFPGIGYRLDEPPGERRPSANQH